MGYQCKTEINVSAFAEFSKVSIIKLLFQVSYYGHRGTETVYYILLHETGSFCFDYLGKSLGFHLAGEVVCCYYYVLGLAGSSREGPD